MSSKYKFVKREGVYFSTSTLVGRVDLFTREVYRNLGFSGVSQPWPCV
ncbi:MAG: hypothetical protein V4722_27860 [Bacteroidota bacterium]